jgi:aryl-alcohol dehydrogenase-like predicted oxidoreductase
LQAAILPACRELGVAITAYGVLSRGLIGGHFAAARELAATDFRAWRVLAWSSFRGRASRRYLES